MLLNFKKEIIKVYIPNHSSMKNMIMKIVMETYGEHREYLEFGISEYKELINYAKEIEIDFFSTPFDFNSVEFLEN